MARLDAGHGWLIFVLQPAEAAFHPSESNDAHELFFVCDDLPLEVAAATWVSISRNMRWLWTNAER
jgi:hypothetical protein